jgi:ferredoxin
MAHVITQKCVGTCDTACVDVCPVDCIAGPIAIDRLRALPAAQRGQLFIDPDECIDCGACLDTCPAAAIYLDDHVPAAHRADIARNAEFFASTRADDPAAKRG